MAVKCPKCGGEVVQATPEIAKCKKCGAAFKRKAPVIQEEMITPQKKQRKKGGGCLKVVLIVFIVLIALGVIGTLFSNEPKKVGNKNMGEGAEQSEEKEDEKTDVFSVGETAELNDVQVTMTDYKESTGTEWNSPSGGNVFVLIEFEIANNSSEELAISSALSFEAYADDYALNYALNAMMDNEQTQLDGNIASGKKMRGWIGYEVPENWKNLEIHFADNVWVGNKFKFNISK